MKAIEIEIKVDPRDVCKGCSGCYSCNGVSIAESSVNVYIGEEIQSSLPAGTYNSDTPDVFKRIMARFINPKYPRMAPEYIEVMHGLTRSDTAWVKCVWF